MAYCDAAGAAVAAEATLCGVDITPLPPRLALPALPALPDVLMPWPADNDDDEAISNYDRLRRTLGLSGLEPRRRLLQAGEALGLSETAASLCLAVSPMISSPSHHHRAIEAAVT